MRWSEVAPRGWRLGSLARGHAAGGRGGAAHRARRAGRERREVHGAARGDRAARDRPDGELVDRGRRRRLRHPARRRSIGSSTGSPAPTTPRARGRGRRSRPLDRRRDRESARRRRARWSRAPHGTVFALSLPAFRPIAQMPTDLSAPVLAELPTATQGTTSTPHISGKAGWIRARAAGVTGSSG